MAENDDRRFFTALGGCAALALLVRLVFLLTTVNLFDAEENYRLLFAMQWPDSGLTMVAPLHLMLLKPLIAITHKPLLIGRLLSLVFGVGAVAMLMLAARRIFGGINHALVAGLSASIAWPLVQYGALSKVEPIYVFFLLLTLWLLTASERKVGGLVAAGLSLTAAGALRFEAWFYIPLIASFLLWREKEKRWTKTVAFAAAASLFPVTWLAVSLIALGDPLASFRSISEQGVVWETLLWLRTIAGAFTWPLLALVIVGAAFGKKRWLSLIFVVVLLSTTIPQARIGLPADDLKYLIAPLCLAVLIAVDGLLVVSTRLRKKGRVVLIAVALTALIVFNVIGLIRAHARQQQPPAFAQLEAFLADRGASPWDVDSLDYFEPYRAYLQLRLYEYNPQPMPPPAEINPTYLVGKTMVGAPVACPGGWRRTDIPPWVVCRR